MDVDRVFWKGLVCLSDYRDRMAVGLTIYKLPMK